MARRDKTAPMSEISKLSKVRDAIVDVFTFLLKKSFLSIVFAKLWYDSLLWNRGLRKINLAEIGYKI